MDNLLNRLLQSAPSLAPSGRLPAPLLRGEVLEARVLSNTLLQPAGSEGAPRYRAELEVAGRTLRVTSSTPLAQDQLLRLALDSGGRLRLLEALPGRTAPGAPAAPAAATANQNAARPAPTSTTSATPAPPASSADAGSRPPPTPPPPQQWSQLQHWARLLLPQQQPLRELVPVLERWLGSPPPPAAPAAGGSASSVTTPPPTGLNTTGVTPGAPTAAPGTSAASTALPFETRAEARGLEAAQQLARQWLSRLPTAETLSDAEGLRAALRESGTLAESLWGQSTRQPGSPPPTDQKSLLLQLLNLLQRPTPPRGEAATARSAPVPEAPPPPDPGRARTAPDPGTRGGAEAEPPRPGQEALLRQLNAALARTQLHQLDSLAARQSHSGDPQQPNAAWNFELPVRAGAHMSTLELQIQRRDGGKEGGTTRSRWSVDLHLDLHEYGHFSAQLHLLGQRVSATLWAEKADTHERVKSELANLRGALEAVGVEVQKLDCRRGSPPTPQPLLRRQLVDLRT